MEFFISICITSYNRPIQLLRCLNSITTKYINKIEIVIGDDRSPNWPLISKVVDEYKQKSPIYTTLIVNPENLGYDLNFHNLINKSSGKYLVFITDDDAFVLESIDKVIDTLKSNELSVAFTPYFNREINKLCRNHPNKFNIQPGIVAVEQHLYNSILLSGLIFRRDTIPKYDPYLFKGLIYSQVFVFICILYEFGGAYLNIPFIDYIGDGENGFGKNEGEDKNPLLANRAHYLSNLEYNKRLVKITKLFDTRFGTQLHASVSKTYSIRTITGLCYARGFSINALKEYRDAVYSVGFDLGVLPRIYYYFIRILGFKLTSKVIIIGKHVYRTTWNLFH